MLFPSLITHKHLAEPRRRQPGKAGDAQHPEVQGSSSVLLQPYHCIYLHVEELRGIFQIVLHCLLAAAGTAGAKSHLSVVCIKWPELEAADVLTHGGAGCEGGWLSDK